MDVEEACCADVYSDGEIKPIFQEGSYIPGKQRQGGQSAARFAANRDNEITQWFKKIDRTLMEVKRESIILGINFVYKNRFLNTLHTYNQQKIKDIRKTEYTNLTGVYQMVNVLEQEKKNPSPS
jgi:peptide subunit release factor 1 (eRF1)